MSLAEYYDYYEEEDIDYTTYSILELVHETEKAVLLRFKHNNENAWIPKSQIEDGWYRFEEKVDINSNFNIKYLKKLNNKIYSEW